MKKVILLLLFAIGMIASAQSFNSKIYYEYTGVAGDTAISGTDAAVSWQVLRNDIYLYRVEVELDEISGSANGIAILQGSLNNSDWFEIDTLANTSGTEAQTGDATVLIEDLSTGVVWRYMRIIVNVSTTGKWDVNFIRFRAVGKNYYD
jgi:hypothetical protein